MSGGLEWSAVTLASHVLLILSVGFVFFNAVAVMVFVSPRPARIPFGTLTDPIIFLGISLVTERAYYVAARLMVNTEIDLWSAHPAPELLSLMVGATLFWLAVSVSRLAGGDHLFMRRVLAAEIAFVALLVPGLVWRFW